MNIDVNNSLYLGVTFVLNSWAMKILLSMWWPAAIRRGSVLHCVCISFLLYIVNLFESIREEERPAECFRLLSQSPLASLYSPMFFSPVPTKRTSNFIGPGYHEALLFQG